MTHQELLDAAEVLRDAVAVAPDDGLADRLRDQADQLETLAGRDPDHGRMARHESKLHDVADDGGAEVGDAVEEALSLVHQYRETVEGV